MSSITTSISEGNIIRNMVSKHHPLLIQFTHTSSGPIIRINPYEVHINDPDFYKKLYVGAIKGRSDEWYWSVSLPIFFSLRLYRFRSQWHKLNLGTLDAHVWLTRRVYH